MGLEFDGVNGIIKNSTSDGDVTIKGNDGGSEISALILDMSAEGGATFNNWLEIPDYIYHTADSNTYFGFNANDNFELFVGGTDRLSIVGSQTVFNDGSADKDFRVESNGNEYMLFVDGGNNAVGIGTSSPTAQLTVADDIHIVGATPSLTFTDTDNNADAMVYNASGNLYLEADKNDEQSDSLMRFAIDDVPVAQWKTSELAFNEESNNTDFRVESNNKTHALFVDAGNDRVGFITAPDLGNVHIRVDDTGASSSSDADELVLEKNGACGLSILSANSSAGNIFFGDDGDNDKGFIAYGHAVDDMFFSVNGNGGVYALVLHDSNAISTSGETAPDVNEGGITLDQNANDGNIITFKSSDIAHGITGTAETDTYATFKKHSATNGGIAIVALSEATETIKLNANPTSVDTTKSTSGVGTHIIAVSKNGNAAAGTDANLLVVNNHTTTQFIFDAEGTFHSNVGTATYDAYDDAHLVRAMDLSTSTKGLIASKFDDFIQYNHEDLANAKIVGREEDGTPNSMVNWTAMSQLHNGAIWQQYEKHQKLVSAFYKLAEKTIGKEEADKLLTDEEIQLLN